MHTWSCLSWTLETEVQSLGQRVGVEFAARFVFCTDKSSANDFLGVRPWDTEEPELSILRFCDTNHLQNNSTSKDRGTFKKNPQQTHETETRTQKLGYGPNLSFPHLRFTESYPVGHLRNSESFRQTSLKLKNSLRTKIDWRGFLFVESSLSWSAKSRTRVQRWETADPQTRKLKQPTCKVPSSGVRWRACSSSGWRSPCDRPPSCPCTPHGASRGSPAWGRGTAAPRTRGSPSRWSSKRPTPRSAGCSASRRPHVPWWVRHSSRPFSLWFEIRHSRSEHTNLSLVTFVLS